MKVTSEQKLTVSKNNFFKIVQQKKVITLDRVELKYADPPSVIYSRAVVGTAPIENSISIQEPETNVENNSGCCSCFCFWRK